MKNIFILAVVLSAGVLNAQTQSIEEINAKLARAGIVMQEALALCYKKCDLIKAKDTDCQAAKDFVNSAARTCHEMCDSKADWEAMHIKEGVAHDIIRIAEEEYRSTHK